MQVERHRQLGVLTQHRPDRPAGQPVRQVQVVYGGERGGAVGDARRVHPGPVTQVGGAPGFVERGPHGDPRTQFPRHPLGVGGERDRRLPVRPAALVLEFLRQVPVVEGGDRLHAGLDQRVDQPRVERDALGVELAGAARLHPRPGDREPVGLQPQVLDVRDVLRPPVVVVVGDVAGVTVQHASRRVAVGVPDRRTTAAFLGSSLDLVGGGGRPPQKSCGEGAGGAGHQWVLLVLRLRSAEPNGDPDTARHRPAGRGRRSAVAQCPGACTAEPARATTPAPGRCGWGPATRSNSTSARVSRRAAPPHRRRARPARSPEPRPARPPTRAGVPTAAPRRSDRPTAAPGTARIRSPTRG